MTECRAAHQHARIVVHHSEQATSEIYPPDCRIAATNATLDLTILLLRRSFPKTAAFSVFRPLAFLADKRTFSQAGFAARFDRPGSVARQRDILWATPASRMSANALPAEADHRIQTGLIGRCKAEARTGRADPLPIR